MSAREKILRYVEHNQDPIGGSSDPGTGFFVYEPQAHVSQLLDAYAHELAEKIRSSEGPDSIEERFFEGALWAANLIDPEVTS